MGKPLLTDEIIDRANRGENFDDFYDDDFDGQKTKVISTEETFDASAKRGFFSSKKDKPIIKSRRIENARRNAFQAKINRILLIVILLIAILLAAIFYL
ncbi:cell wall synthase accessory phosphoprotein MacP [Streptococcus thoraltensis]|uniref:cell wall synthase accessory phosphoprotein MacP n=1 Tax=Streptococcus thoraltensis TaxID=55085 RepID=UPI00037B12D4|nr:cell wall synthase accessory phosphoprotein MacP [Streptococcus thoraltensis]MDY4762024.1 cell wall synthase accessory phosphoprotein MacP [Streptococcus thoraltensis]